MVALRWVAYVLVVAVVASIVGTFVEVLATEFQNRGYGLEVAIVAVVCGMLLLIKAVKKLMRRKYE